MHEPYKADVRSTFITVELALISSLFSCCNMIFQNKVYMYLIKTPADYLLLIDVQ